MIDRIRIPGGVFGVTSAPSGLWGVAAQAEQVLSNTGFRLDENAD